MTRAVEVWFEFASTYSYPAMMRIEAACAARRLPLLWRPFLLGPVFAAQGLTTSPFTLFPVKGAYMWRDLQRICAAAGLPLMPQSVFPRGSLLAARIVCAHPEAPWIGAFIRAVYSANFGHDRDVGRQDVLAAILAELGCDPAAVIAAAVTPETKSALRAQTEAAQAKGIFGAPSFVVGEELFWGNDRLETALVWAAA